VPPTKQDIIDAIVGDATKRQFTGDWRDGDAPLIDLKNFHTESFRYGAKALRARLSRLSYAELWSELDAAERVAFLEEEGMRFERAAGRQAHSRQQSERARKSRLSVRCASAAILEAARHYRSRKVRNRKIQAEEAWREIRRQPYETSAGNRVRIEDDKMLVRSPEGGQIGRSIKPSQWRNSYWPKAKT
jgi:hypothetical protein